MAHGRMRNGAPLTTRVRVIAFMALMMAPPAAAYLDPGTGSYLFQLLLGAALGGLMAIKMYWRRIVDLARRLLGRSDSPPRHDA